MKLTIRSFKVRFEVGSEEETEQVIRYTDDGRLFFRGYIQNHVLSRKQYIRLTGHDQALVNAIAGKLMDDYELTMFAPDGDRWEMEIEDDNYEVYTFYGSMEGYNIYGIDMTALFKSLLPFDNLYLFGE